MKLYISHLLALCFFHANVCGTTAFSVTTAKATRAAVALRSSPTSDEVRVGSFLTVGTDKPVEGFTETSSALELLTPVFPELQRIEGNSVHTYKMPHWAERCQMIFATSGRPLKADIEMMLGPLRTTHQLKLDIEDGNITPYQATLKFKKADQVLRITTPGHVHYPMLFGLYVPSPEQSEALEANTLKVWDTCSPNQKQRLQGGTTDGGPGAYRYWTVPKNVKSVQVLVWSKDVGKKSLKVTLEVLQGPHNSKQNIFLQCGGGSQPYHSVIQTPEGGSIGVRNKKFLEDGLMEIAFVPYEMFD
jgi:hypothetical protein